MMDKASVALALIAGLVAALYVYHLATVAGVNPLDSWKRAETKGDCLLYVYPNGTSLWRGACSTARLCAYTYRIYPNGTLVRAASCGNP